MGSNLFVAWFLVDEPCYPVLLYVGSIQEKESSLPLLQRVRESGEEMAKQYRIYKTVHVGTYSAYLSILLKCIHSA